MATVGVKRLNMFRAELRCDKEKYHFLL